MICRGFENSRLPTTVALTCFCFHLPTCVRVVFIHSEYDAIFVLHSYLKNISGQGQKQKN